jgi:hypothetical protein
LESLGSGAPGFFFLRGPGSRTTAVTVISPRATGFFAELLVSLVLRRVLAMPIPLNQK